MIHFYGCILLNGTFFFPQVLHHVYHDGSGPARLHRKHRGEGGPAPQNHPISSRVEKQPGQHVWLCRCDESPGAAAGKSDTDTILHNKQKNSNVFYQIYFLKCNYVSHCFRFPALSRHGWHYARDTQRALFFMKRNSNLSWRIWTMAKVRTQFTWLAFVCILYLNYVFIYNSKR